MTSAAGAFPAQAKAATTKEESQFTVVARRFMRHHLAVFSLGLIIIIFTASVLAPVITTYPRDAIDVGAPVRPAPPGISGSAGLIHILGIDNLGRDLFTRVLYAGRISLSIALSVVLLSESMGSIIGAVAGYYGGWIDAIVSRLIEFMLSIPLLPILLIVSAILIKTGSHLPLPTFVVDTMGAILLTSERETQQVVVLVLILVVFGWLGAARLMRGMALTLREQDFVESLRALRRVRCAHHLPAYHPQWPGADSGECQPFAGRRHHFGGRAQFFGLGHSRSNANLGQYACPIPKLHVPKSVAPFGAGHPVGVGVA